MTPKFFKDAEGSYLIKILLQHLSFLALLNTVSFDISGKLKDSISIFTGVSPSEDYSAFSFECFINNSPISVSFMKLYVSLIYFFFFFFVFLALVVFKELKKNRGNNNNNKNNYNNNQEEWPSKIIKSIKNNVVLIFLVIFMENLTSFLVPYVDLFSCIRIEDSIEEQRLLGDTVVRCWETQWLDVGRQLIWKIST